MSQTWLLRKQSPRQELILILYLGGAQPGQREGGNGMQDREDWQESQGDAWALLHKKPWRDTASSAGPHRMFPDRLCRETTVEKPTREMQRRGNLATFPSPFLQTILSMPHKKSPPPAPPPPRFHHLQNHTSLFKRCGISPKSGSIRISQRPRA